MEETEDTSVRVLASTVLNLTDEKYSRGFNLLNNMPENVSVDALCFGEETDITHPNIRPYPITGDIVSRTVKQILEARKRLNTGSYDVYHRFNLMYGGWNPFLQTGSLETPTIIGPVEPHHEFKYNQFKRIFLDGVGFDFGETINKSVYRGVMSLKTAIDWVRIPMFKNTLQNADKVVVVNESTKEFYSEFVDSTSHFEIIPIGTRIEKFTYNPATESTDIVFVGNMTERKQPMDIIRAMPDILTEVPDAHLHLVGSGPKETVCQELAEELQVSDSVTVHGFVEFDTLTSLLSSSRIFIHPSHSDSYFHSRLEAMASGCVVIGTNLLGADDIITDGENGYLYPVGDTETLATKTVTVLQNPSLSEQISKTARKYVEENHDWEDISAEYYTLYQEISSN